MIQVTKPSPWFVIKRVTSTKNFLRRIMITFEWNQIRTSEKTDFNNQKCLKYKKSNLHVPSSAGILCTPVSIWGFIQYMYIGFRANSLHIPSSSGVFSTQVFIWGFIQLMHFCLLTDSANELKLNDLFCTLLPLGDLLFTHHHLWRYCLYKHYNSISYYEYQNKVGDILCSGIY